MADQIDVNPKHHKLAAKQLEGQIPECLQDGVSAFFQQPGRNSHVMDGNCQSLLGSETSRRCCNIVMANAKGTGGWTHHKVVPVRENLLFLLVIRMRE
jgi:hypothetical protein